MKRPEIIAIFVVEYQHNGQRYAWKESVTASIAYSLGRQLAKQGMKPTVRRVDMHLAEVRRRGTRL